MTADVARNVNDTVIKGYGISGSAAASPTTQNTILAEFFVDDLDFAVLGLCLVQELFSSKICLADVIVGRFEEKKKRALISALIYIWPSGPNTD